MKDRPILNVCSASRGEDSDKNLVPTQKGSTVQVTSQTRTSVILPSMIVIVLPPLSFGFSRQNTDN